MSEQQEYQEEFVEDQEEIVEEGLGEDGGDDGSIGDLSVEEQARMVGWNPDHPAGKSAEEFLARNQEHLGMQRAENEKLYTKIDELNQAMALQTKFLEQKEEKAVQQAYDRAIKAMEAKMEAAVEDADRGAFDEAKEEANKLRRAKEEYKVDPIIPEKNEAAEKMQQFVTGHFSNSPPEMFDLESKKNDWIAELTAQGRAGKTLEEAAKLADKAVIQRYGLKRNIPGVSGGNSERSGKASKLSDIPGAQAAYNSLIKKIPDLTVEEYLEGIQ